MIYTVNCRGNIVSKAKSKGYHAYYANGVTAVEIKADSKAEALRIARRYGWFALYVFE